MEPKMDETITNGVPLLTWSSEISLTSVRSSAGNQVPNDSNPSDSKNSEQKKMTHLQRCSSNRGSTKADECLNICSIDCPVDSGPGENSLVYGCDKVKFSESLSNLKKLKKNGSMCSKSSHDTEVNKKPKVADGGWGWIVVASSFIISMIADGISFSFGLLYIEFLIDFEESKSKTSWIGSLFMAVPLLTGPIMSALVDRFGCKYMTMLGGMVSASGFILATFGKSIEWEYVTFGFIAGCGLGLCYVTAVVSIAYWFDKYRTLAMGLGACGTGLGTFIFAPLTQYLIDEYCWRGTVLLLAGWFLNMCVCGAVMRDPEWVIAEEKKQEMSSGTKSLKKSSSCGSINRSIRSQNFQISDVHNILKCGEREPVEQVLPTLIHPMKDSVTADEYITGSVVNFRTFSKQKEKMPLEVVHHLMNNINICTLIMNSSPTLAQYKSNSDGQLNRSVELEAVSSSSASLNIQELNNSEIQLPKALEKFSEVHLVFNDRQSLNTNSTITDVVVRRPRRILGMAVCGKEPGPYYLRNLRMHRNSMMYRGAMLNIPRYRLRASSCPDIFRNSTTTIAKDSEEKWYGGALEILKEMVDFSMFLELHFFLMSVGTILLFISFIVPYFYLAEHLTRYGYTEVEASHMLSVIGIANCIGMVSLGWAGDQPWVNVTKTYAVCLVLCGTCCLLIPVTTSHYYVLGAVAAFFGIFFSSNYSFTPTILIELMPLERFTVAYGLMLLCQGIGNLIGPPLAGWIFDVTNNWDLTFYLAGIWIIASGVLVILIPITKNRRIWGTGVLEMDRVSNA